MHAGSKSVSGWGDFGGREALEPFTPNTGDGDSSLWQSKSPPGPPGSKPGARTRGTRENGSLLRLGAFWNLAKKHHQQMTEYLFGNETNFDQPYILRYDGISAGCDLSAEMEGK